MVKEILLTQGKVALVDDDDFDRMNKYKWYASKDVKNNDWYARRNETIQRGSRKTFKQKTIRMHQEIFNFKYQLIDHANHNGLDNRKCNLRACTYSENKKNSRQYKNNTSGFIGVSWHKIRRKWYAYVNKNGVRFSLGYFDDKIEAGKIVDKKSIELFGEFAVLNFPEG